MVSALSVCLWMARNVSAWRKSPIHYWKITLTMRYIIDELPWASLAFNVLQYRLVKSSESQQNCLISSIHPVNYAIFILEFSRQKRDFFFVVKLRLLGYFPSLWLISTFQRFFLFFSKVGNSTEGGSNADFFSEMRNDYQEGSGTIMQKFLRRQCTPKVTRKLCFWGNNSRQCNEYIVLNICDNCDQWHTCDQGDFYDQEDTCNY